MRQDRPVERPYASFRVPGTIRKGPSDAFLKGKIRVGLGLKVVNKVIRYNLERKKSKKVGHVRRSATGRSFDPAQLFLFVWLVEVVESPHASFRVPRMI